MKVCHCQLSQWEEWEAWMETIPSSGQVKECLRQMIMSAVDVAAAEQWTQVLV